MYLVTNYTAYAWLEEVQSTVTQVGSNYIFEINPKKIKSGIKQSSGLLKNLNKSVHYYYKVSFG